MSTSRIILQRCRVACRVALALALFLLPHRATAYQFIYEGTLPVAWRSLPVPFIADVNPTSVPTFQTTVSSAFTVWNNVATARNIFGAVTNSTVDFTGANFRTAWGVMPAAGDANHESSATSTARRSPPSARPAPWAGRCGNIASSAERPTSSTGCSSSTARRRRGANFNHLAARSRTGPRDRPAPLVAPYMPGAGRLLPLPDRQRADDVPPRIPDNDVATAALEADDIAGISELYREPTVCHELRHAVRHRHCGAAPTIPARRQRARGEHLEQPRPDHTVHGLRQGNLIGRYEMKVPAGTYKLIIEVMNLPEGSMGMLTTVADDFASEYRSESRR